MRRLLTVAGLAVGAAGLLAGQANAAVPPLPKGTYYGQLSGLYQQLPVAKCPASLRTDAPPSCLQIRGPFTVAASGGKKITGTYNGFFVPGDPDSTGTGQCARTNELFTFTAGKGNTFSGVQPSLGTDRICLISLGPGAGRHNPILLTTYFDMTITGGTGRFHGLQGAITQDGAIVSNVSADGDTLPSGKTNAALTMSFGPSSG